jgi:hypothetical protein
MKISKNKIKTAGYFIKRLRDSGFIVLKMFFRYGKHDPRRWTVMVDPGSTSVFITCFNNKESLDEISFELNDGGILFPKNFSIKTNSLEVIINYMLSKGVRQADSSSLYIKKQLNNIVNEEEKQQAQL